MGGKTNRGGNKPQDDGGEDKKDFKFDFNDKKEKPFTLTNEQTAQLLPMLQSKLGSIVGTSSGYLETLPISVQKRVTALKNLHDRTEKLEEEFRKEEAALIQKYNQLKAPLYDRRAEIVDGKAEPTAEELIVKKKEEEKAPKTDAPKPEEGIDIKGIPDFWLNALKHHDDFMDMISEEDEGALKHLYDIQCTKIEEEETPSPSFALKFFFHPNEYFEDTVLTKTYHLVNDLGEILLENYESSEIKWKQGKNLTKKFVTKPQKQKGGKGGRGGRGGKNSGPAKMVTVEEDVQSFFRFFSPEPTPEEFEDEQEMQDFMEADYELGMFLREVMIPNAVMFFTGEMPPMYGNEYGDEGEDEEGEEGEEEEYNSDEDEDFDPKSVPQGQQPECKQQ